MPKGFTLIEMLVSVAIFSVVMVIALGALLSISVSDRKAESLKSVINNLNFSLDSMSRALRTGTNWGCDVNRTLIPSAQTDCSGGANEIMFTSSSGVVTYYRLESLTDDNSNAASMCGQTSPNVGCIVRSTDGGATWSPVTAPEVIITDYSGTVTPSYLFYLVGSKQGGVSSPEPAQPKLVIMVSGYVKVGGGASSQAACNTPGNQCSVFHFQTTVTQRLYDQ